ncbi:MAG TPA: hypothetical protein PK865_02635 [Candidatus Saccharibacteria bacterium]|nr:hypothetical protein [Candidatus Saccharibacteria bacterium]
MLEDRLNADIKAALLGGDQFTATTLRGLKATILNVKVAGQPRPTDVRPADSIDFC